MPGVISFLSAADIPGTNAYVQPPLALFEAQPVSFMYQFAVITVVELYMHR